MQAFRDHATRFLAGTEPLALSNLEVVTGFYIPAPQERERSLRALAEIGIRVQQILTEGHVGRRIRGSLSGAPFAALFQGRPAIK